MQITFPPTNTPTLWKSLTAPALVPIFINVSNPAVARGICEFVVSQPKACPANLQPVSIRLITGNRLGDSVPTQADVEEVARFEEWVNGRKAYVDYIVAM